MGRYYWGDIDGKFAFAIQSSNDADFFGVTGERPERLEYYFDKENLPELKEGIKKCKVYLVNWKPKLEKFFKDRDAYIRDDLAKFLKVDETKMREIQRWDARLNLGKKIEKCIEKNGECHFEVEL